MPIRNSKDSDVDSEFENSFYLNISIKEIKIDSPLILDLTIREWIFDALPRLELEFFDNGRFIDQYPLEDNDEIVIEMNNISLRDPIINAKFTLLDYEIINGGPGQSQNATIKLTAVLKSTNMLYPLQNRVFSGKNSNEVFKMLAEENDFEYISDIIPNDNMNWLQINKNNLNFIDHVLKRAFIIDDVPFLFVNRKNQMVYTSLKTATESQTERKTFFFDMPATILNTGANHIDTVRNTLEKEEELLGNNTSFFMNWSYKCVAGIINKQNSYGQEFNFYDNTEEQEEIVDSDNIILTTHSHKDQSLVGRIVKHTDFGVFDGINTHDNYLKAMVKNDYLKTDFFNSYLTIYARPEVDVNLFDVVDIKIPSTLQIDDTIDEVHSGEYVVGGIIHNVSRKSNYNSVLILFRNGRNISGYLKDDEIKNSKKSSDKPRFI
jgi:hypothetical protein